MPILGFGEYSPFFVQLFVLSTMLFFHHLCDTHQSCGFCYLSHWDTWLSIAYRLTKWGALKRYILKIKNEYKHTHTHIQSHICTERVYTNLLFFCIKKLQSLEITSCIFFSFMKFALLFCVLFCFVSFFDKFSLVFALYWI